MPKMVDFQCPQCESTFEYLKMYAHDQPEKCPVCLRHPIGDARFVEVLVSMPLAKTIVRGNSDYNERERERLEKRSQEHWHREGRDEAIERSRAQMKRYHGVK